MRPPLSLLLVVSSLLFCACGKSRTPPAGRGTAGTWLSASEALLFDIEASGELTIFLAAGGGSCVRLTEAEIEGGAIVDESGASFPYDLDGDTLTVEDPTFGVFEGVFSRVTRSDICFVNVPPLGEVADGVIAPALSEDGPRRVTFTLEVPDDAVGFVVHAIGPSVGSAAGFSRLEDPAGTEHLRQTRDLQFCLVGQCSLMIPKEASIPPAAGAWSITFEGQRADALDGLEIVAWIRRGEISAPAVIPVHAVLAANFADAEARSAIEDASAILSANGVVLALEGTTVSDGPTELVQDFLHPDTAAAMSLGDPARANLVFTDRLIGAGGSLGLASGIPGALGVAGPWNALVIDLDAHRDRRDRLNETLLAETIAHEIGHLLGLFHTTESDGRVFDLLSDTPVCEADTFDLDDDGFVFADECPDGDNILFWTPATAAGSPFPQSLLSAEQVFVLSRSVVAR